MDAQFNPSTPPAIRLRILEGPTLATTPLPIPARARFRLDGVTYSLTYWMEAQWNKIPLSQRPANAIRDDRGGRRVIEPEEG